MDLITLTDPRSARSEAYRALRTNLSFYGLDEPLKTLVAAAPAPDEQMTKAVANLAVTMAQSGKRTILVDCDLRRPSLHTLFEAKNDVGVTEAVLDDSAEPHLQNTAIPNLRILTSGTKPPNPADLLGSGQMTRVIAHLTQQADFILFNAPPVAAVTDAAVLGAKTDGVLLLIRAGKTRRDHAEKARQILEQAHVRIIGAALLDAPADSSLGTY